MACMALRGRLQDGETLSAEIYLYWLDWLGIQKLLLSSCTNKQ